MVNVYSKSSILLTRSGLKFSLIESNLTESIIYGIVYCIIYIYVYMVVNDSNGELIDDSLFQH